MVFCLEYYVIRDGLELGLRDNVEKYCRAGQAINVNMAHPHCVLIT